MEVAWQTPIPWGTHAHYDAAYLDVRHTYNDLTLMHEYEAISLRPEADADWNLRTAARVLLNDPFYEQRNGAITGSCYTMAMSPDLGMFVYHESMEASCKRLT